MLLLVMQADLQDAHNLRQLATPRRSPTVARPPRRHGRGTPRPGAVRPRDEAALGPRVARAGGHIIGVEEIGELRVEDTIARQDAGPGGIARGTRWCARDATWSGSHRASTAPPDPRAERRGAPLGLRAHGAEGIAPDEPRIVLRGVLDGGGTTFVAGATKDGGRCRGRHAQSRVGEIQIVGDEKLLWAIDCSVIIRDSRQQWLRLADILCDVSRLHARKNRLCG